MKLALSLGSNLGDRRAYLRSGLSGLERRGWTVTACSSLYETPPWGNENQGPFYNACALLEGPSRNPETVLDDFLAVERDCGRVRLEKWGPRTLDLDLLWIEGCSYDSPRLKVPHPLMVHREFVLLPLAEIAPALLVFGQRVDQHLAALPEKGAARLVETAWWNTAK